MKIITPGDPGFYINRKRYHELESDVRVGVEGIFTMRAIKPGIGVVREVSFPNLITDVGMNAIGSGLGFNRMHLGTGTTTPSFGDTSLAAFGVNVVASNPTSTGGAAPSSPYYGYTQYTWTSSVGGATGNWTEIGVSNQNTNGNLRSRALILDGGGSPTVFPVLSDEQFQGTWEFRSYAPLTDNPASITLSGTPYNTTTRALRVTTVGNGWGTPGLVSATAEGLFWLRGGTPQNNTSGMYTGALAAITANNPAGSVLTGSLTATQAAYGSGNFYRDGSLRAGAAIAVGSIKTVKWHTDGAQFQVEYASAINKLTTEEFVHNQRISWARR